MATIPYPPAPELGRYADDPVDKPAAVSSAAAEPSPSHPPPPAMRPRARPTAISRTGTARCCRRPSPPRRRGRYTSCTTTPPARPSSSTRARCSDASRPWTCPKAPRPRRSRIRRVPHRAIMPRSASIRTARCRSRTTVPQRHLHHPRRAGSAGAQGQAARTRRPRHAAYRRPVLPTHRAPVAALHCPSCEIPSGESPIQRRKTGL